MLTPSIFFTLTVFHTHLHTRSPIDLCKDRPLAGPLLSFILCLPRVVIPFVSPVSPSDVFHCLQQQPHGDGLATVTSGASVMLIPSPPLVNNLPSFFTFIFSPPISWTFYHAARTDCSRAAEPEETLVKKFSAASACWDDSRCLCSSGTWLQTGGGGDSERILVCPLTLTSDDGRPCSPLDPSEWLSTPRASFITGQKCDPPHFSFGWFPLSPL